MTRKIKYNRHTNVLEEEVYKYDLQDTRKPQLYKEIFPYNDVPRIVFNHRLVPMLTPAQVWITDTTFRDGQQSRPPMSVKQILKLYDMLHELGGKCGLIRQSEFFLYSKKDQEALEKCMERGYEFPEVTGWIRAHPKDFKLVKRFGLKETGILTSASDYHIFLKLKTTRKKAMDKYLGVVKQLLAEGIIPRCHLEDITRADFYGFVVPFCHELRKLSQEAKMPIKIRACDTLGLGVTYPGLALPRSVKGIIYGLRTFADLKAEQLEWHGHNDFYRAVTNATTAWLYGCSGANGTLLGIGERTGNTPIEALIVEYISLRGKVDGIHLHMITEIKEFFEKDIGYKVPEKQPFVGKDFNVTRAGIHADGLLKSEQIYNIFNTSKLLNRPPGVAITDKSGTSSIAHWINAYFKLKKQARLSKDDPNIAKIKEWIDLQYSTERTTVISDEEILEQVRIHLPNLKKK